MLERIYNPQNYACGITVKVTEEQAKRLDALWKRKQFDAYFWAEKVEWLNNNNFTNTGEKVARIDGRHYVIGKENATGFRGNSGHRFKIKFYDGEIIETTNLWEQGSIPEELKDILVDNAEWRD